MTPRRSRDAFPHVRARGDPDGGPVALDRLARAVVAEGGLWGAAVVRGEDAAPGAAVRDVVTSDARVSRVRARPGPTFDAVAFARADPAREAERLLALERPPRLD